MPATFLESGRLWYRMPVAADAPLFTAYLNDPRVRRNLGIGRFPFNEMGEAKWIESRSLPPVVDGATDVTLCFGMKGEDAPLGGTGLHKINWLNRHAEWGIYIGKPTEWGKGYGREVARTMLRYAFGTLNLHRVNLRVNDDNVGGIKAYEAAGFKHEGVFRQVVFVDGKYRDQCLMAALHDEWHDA